MAIGILDRLLYAEVKATAIDASTDPGAAPVARAEFRLFRDDGTDAGVVRDPNGASPSWTGVVPVEELETQFYNLEIEPGVPAPLNAVLLFVKATVNDANRVDFDLRSNAVCIR